MAYYREEYVKSTSGGLSIPTRWNYKPGSSSRLQLAGQDSDGSSATLNFFNIEKGVPSGAAITISIKKSSGTRSEKIKLKDAFTEDSGRFDENIYTPFYVRFKYEAPYKPGYITVPSSVDYSSSISVKWEKAPGSTKSRLERSVNGGSYSTVLSATSSTSYSDSNASSSWKNVRYRVRGSNDEGDSDWCVSDLVTITIPSPGTPSNVKTPSSVYTDENISISWSSGSNVDNYRLERSVNGGSYSVVSSSLTSTSYTDRGVSSSWNSAKYRVRSENKGGNSSWAYSNSVSVSVRPIPSPSAPSSLTVPSVVEAGEPFEITWGSGSYASSYRLQRKVDGGSYSSVYSGSGRSYKDTATKGWKIIEYRVYSSNSSGTSSYRYSDPVKVVSFPEMGLNINNELKKTVDGWVNVDGSLKTIDMIWVRVNGELKEVK